MNQPYFFNLTDYTPYILVVHCTFYGLQPLLKWLNIELVMEHCYEPTNYLRTIKEY